MENKDIKFSIRNKLILLFVITGFIPILCLIFFINNIKSDKNVSAIMQNAHSTMKSSIDIMDKSIQELMKEESISVESKLIYLKKLPYISDCSINNKSNSSGIWIPLDTNNEKVYIEIDTIYLTEMLKANSNYEKKIYIKEINNNKDKAIQELNNKYKESSIIEHFTLFGDRILISEIIDKDILFSETMILSEIVIKSTMIVMILSVCLSCIFSYKISYDIDKLVQAMEDIKKGDFCTSIDIKSNDEIGLLAKQFIKMSERLNILINRTLRLKISEREAKIKALQAQISPHFLYNALDLINWKLIDNEDYETSDILISLSNMLRYSIDDSRSMVRLEEELNQIENYLKIQASRFQDRFTYSVYIEEDLKSLNVPKMILQPIVENSINHGVENTKDGHIEIKIYKNLKDILISVYDTGNGMTQERVDYVNNKIKENEQIIDDEDTHIGLSNVNSRLKYIFGEQSKITIESLEGEYTHVLLKIQQERNSNESINC